MQDVQRAGIELERHFLAERPEEPDLAPRPGGFVAVILVRQQVHVVAERRGRLLVLVHPLVDRAERVVNLEIARRQAQRRLRLVQRRLQLAARQQRPRHPVMPARLIGRGTNSPQDIATRLRIARSELEAGTDFRYVIVNDDVERAASQLTELIRAALDEETR